MSGRLLRVLNWATDKGDVETIDRIRLTVLPVTMAEGLVLSQVDESTECSVACLEAVREAAEKVVGGTCPF